MPNVDGNQPLLGIEKTRLSVINGGKYQIRIIEIAKLQGTQARTPEKEKGIVRHLGEITNTRSRASGGK